MSQLFMFPSISSIFFSARRILLWLLLSCFVLFLGWLGGCGSYFFIRRVPDISHTPRIISSLMEILQNGIQRTRLFPGSGPSMSQPFMFPSISSIFFSARSIWLWLLLSCFCHVSVLVGWLCSYFFIRRVPDISHTPRIISHLGKSHRMAFNLALSWTRGSTMS